ncbi:McrC family protein [Paenibacillus rigui]|uniref:Restriction endonuclease n=1 Tax=Paenibacillus rigui TaxID=554312 RepID=A0A229UR64_9BACL|nr:McrC family protein [Paenibacillus rigui]OXM85803.1 restriction endonuclease [Paenibacillus rigui]
MVNTLKNYYVIKEYDSLVRDISGVLPPNLISIPAKTFDELENFIISHKNDSGADALELMSISSKKGIGKVISAKNYVGLVQMSDGTKIEILPKIYVKDQLQSETITRKIFLTMLKSLKNFAFKSFNNSSLGVMKNNLYEIFIQMFVQEAREVTKRGIRSSYIQHEENEKFYKGKIIFNEHIKRNIVHKERFFVSYDLFSMNRSENRIIKTTLKKLLNLSKDLKNIKDIEQLLISFEMVEESVNYEKDFANIKLDRSMKEYQLLLEWCKLFLLNKSFTTFAGKSVAYALLFPMEKIFEAYMGNVISRHLGSQYKIKLQDKSYHLFDKPKQFSLQPDIVLEINDSVIVMDTKWKLLNSLYSNYGISQGDMYQMYAYSKKYNARKIFLLYPLHDGVTGQIEEGLSFYSNDQVEVYVHFVDLQDINHSLKQISKRMKIDQ